MPWGPGHPVHRPIRTGDRWLYAWAMQACTPYPMIERKTGITVQRLLALEAGSAPTGPEYEALAELWRCPLDDLLASMALEGDVRGDRVSQCDE